MNVDDELSAALSYRAPDDPLLDADSVGHHRIPALCHEPEMAVLEREYRGMEIVDRLVQRRNGGVDRRHRLLYGRGCVSRCLDGSGEHGSVERPWQACARRSTFHNG